MAATGRPALVPKSRMGREVISFATIGVLSTAAYATLFLALRPAAGPFVANALALAITAVGNTAANRRITFGVRGRRSMLRDQLGGIVALALALLITTGAAALLSLLVPSADRWLELAVLLAANATATLTRFLVLRTWITGWNDAAQAWGQS
jgi:putative flippase GtrA